MTLSEFEIKRIEKIVGRYVESRRPAAHIRDKLDISFRITGQSFTIFEIRPQWNDPTQQIEGPVARATYVKSKKIWKLYWLRADNKWHLYQPFPSSESLETLLEVIEADKHMCFWG